MASASPSVDFMPQPLFPKFFLLLPVLLRQLLKQPIRMPQPLKWINYKLGEMEAFTNPKAQLFFTRARVFTIHDLAVVAQKRCWQPFEKVLNPPLSIWCGLNTVCCTFSSAPSAPVHFDSQVNSKRCPWRQAVAVVELVEKRDAILRSVPSQLSDFVPVRPDSFPFRLAGRRKMKRQTQTSGN